MKGTLETFALEEVIQIIKRNKKIKVALIYRAHMASMVFI